MDEQTIEPMLELIRKRRTHRKFTDEGISEEQVETLLEMAMVAPNRLNRQPWRFLVIRDREFKQRLADLLRLHPYLETAPVVIAVCAVQESSPTWIMDISVATENMLLAATAMGLGGALVGAPDSALWDMCEEMLHDAANIPMNVRIPLLVALGHPAEELPAHGKHDRFDSTKVHYEKWGNLKLG
jgi:nitroreductase